MSYFSSALKALGLLPKNSATPRATKSKKLVGDLNWNPKYFHIVGICLAASVIITNVFAAKVVEIYGIKLGAGAFLFPFCLIIGDVVTEVYGFKRSRQVIITALICFFFYAAVSQIVIALPPAAGWPHQSAFEAVFSLAPRVFIAGSLAYLAGELMNSFIMSRMKTATNGKGFYGRAIVSTIFGELINSIIFFFTVFLGVLEIGTILIIIINGTIVKTLIEIVVLPLTAAIVRKLKTLEKVDYFD